MESHSDVMNTSKALDSSALQEPETGGTSERQEKKDQNKDLVGNENAILYVRANDLESIASLERTTEVAARKEKNYDWL